MFGGSANRICACVGALIGSMASVASAGSSILVCKDQSSTRTFRIDYDASTVTHLDINLTIPMTVTDQELRWSASSGIPATFVLNRYSGELVMYTPNTISGSGTRTSRYDCSAAEKKF